jgi:hypothetical protein
MTPSHDLSAPRSATWGTGSAATPSWARKSRSTTTPATPAPSSGGGRSRWRPTPIVVLTGPRPSLALVDGGTPLDELEVLGVRASRLGRPRSMRGRPPGHAPGCSPVPASTSKRRSPTCASTAAASTARSYSTSTPKTIGHRLSCLVRNKQADQYRDDCDHDQQDHPSPRRVFEHAGTLATAGRLG